MATVESTQADILPPLSPDTDDQRTDVPSSSDDVRMHHERFNERLLRCAELSGGSIPEDVNLAMGLPPTASLQLASEAYRLHGPADQKGMRARMDRVISEQMIQLQSQSSAMQG